MLNDSGSAHSMPKYSRPLTLEHIQVIHLTLICAGRGFCFFYIEQVSMITVSGR